MYYTEQWLSPWPMLGLEHTKGNKDSTSFFMDLTVHWEVHCKVVLGPIIEEPLRSYGKTETGTGNMYLPGGFERTPERWHLNWSRQARRLWQTVKKSRSTPDAGNDFKEHLCSRNGKVWGSHNNKVRKETMPGGAGPPVHAKKCELCVGNKTCCLGICIYHLGTAFQM